MALNLFSPSRTDEFAKTLAQDIAKRYPPAIANNPEQMVSAKRLTTILEDAFSRAHQFNQENRLGMFKKAKLGKGSKDMAACAMNVQQMMATCDTLQKLASYNSPHLKKMARVAHDVCVDCEKECRKHEKMHAQCQATADACAEVVKEAKKLAI